MKVRVSVIIPVKNEARNLKRCLQSVAWASEVFVVDSQSTDATCDIAAQLGAEVVQYEYAGGWPKKKNWALQTIRFANDWVLLLDADEVVMEGAAREIADLIERRDSVAGYWINRRFMFLGKWLKHAYHPNWNLRLFKHALGRFEQLVEGETDCGDVEIHEHVFVNGQTGRLRTELEHYAFPTVESFIEKHNRYSNWEAQLALELSSKKANARPQHESASLRRRLKLFSRPLPMRPFLRFFYVYVLQRGFLDGIEGYYFAQLHACYEWMSVIKTYERKRYENRRVGD
jgi:glycosyltransferase involved in cell wall biosynthesis